MADKIGDLIICPYCGYVHRDMCDYPKDTHLGNETDMTCWSCDKDFTVIAEASWTFKTYKVEKKESQNER